MIVVGVDLAVKRPSALAALDGCNLLFLAFVRDDDELLQVVNLVEPAVVAIDAPLSEPAGGGLRDVEREMRRLGFKLLPPLMGPMRELTRRGIELSRKLRGPVIEVHPLTSLKSMGCSRRDVAKKYGIYDVDLVDAVAAALTAVAYIRGLYRSVGPFVYPTARVCL